MPSLAEQNCQACNSNAQPVTPAEINQLQPQIPDWQILKPADQSPRLQRTYSFPDFQSTLAFTNQVGEAAETAGHHPALLTEWGKVTVSWWTHAINGLHRNDFIMAAKTDQIAESWKSKIKT